MTSAYAGIVVIFIFGYLTIKSNAACLFLSGKNKTDAPKFPEDCSECGINMKNDGGHFMVLGGSQVEQSKTYPWMVKIQSSVKKCAGAILDELYILTAAHCVTDRIGNVRFYPVKVYFQTSDPMEYLGPGPDVEQIIVHPNYGGVQTKEGYIFKYDIALLKLRKKIKCAEYKNPICLPDGDYKLSTGVRSIIAGWGVINYDYDDQPELLRDGTIKNLDFKKCIEAIPETENVKDHMLCQGGTKQTICTNDLGGPLVHKIKQKYYIVGVASVPTCNTSSVALYTDVAKLQEWIKERKKHHFHVKKKKTKNSSHA